MLAECKHASLLVRPPLHMLGHQPLVSATCSFHCQRSWAADGRGASANHAPPLCPLGSQSGRRRVCNVYERVRGQTCPHVSHIASAGRKQHAEAGAERSPGLGSADA